MSEEPTSPDLAERVRVLLDVGDRAEWEEAIAFFAPDAVWVLADRLEEVEGAAIRDFWASWYEPYTDVRIEALEILALGAGVVLASIRQSGRLGAAQTRVAEEIALVYEWSSGLIDRVTVYLDLGEARTAAERLARQRG
jgi:hypothetical protein